MGGWVFFGRWVVLKSPGVFHFLRMVLSKRQKIVNLEYGIFCECFDVMYSGEYNVSDVILSVYPHRAG